jgi:ferric-dicitrate binding protein FerR (iron transport regulator)
MSHGNTGDDERLLARAVREAARREPPSALARERVRAAVHGQWRAALPAAPDTSAAHPSTEAAGQGQAPIQDAAVPARRARWPLALAASVAVALVSAGLLWQSSRFEGAGTTVALAEVVRGAASVERPGLFGARVAALAPRGAVATRQVVSTGADGAALLRLGPGLTLRLAAHSRLALSTASEVSLEAGTAFIDADPRFGAQPLAVVTPLGRVQHLGTQYSVSATARSLEVAVREGRVQLSAGPAREPLQASAGEALRLEASGAVARGAVAHDDPRWAWLAAVPVPFDLQGAALPAFLEWYARETGLSVEFAAPVAAERAREVRLSGSIAGLSPDEALQVVAASSGLDATRDGDRLVLAFR